MWHIDTTVIRLLDGTKAYVHAVIDNFSRRILAWRVADTFAPVTSVAVLVEASRGATPSETTPVVLADAGVENVNAQVDDLIASGVLRRVLAFTELTFSNSMIEAWWRSLKHQWLFLHSLDSVTTVRRLVEFYVQEHTGCFHIRRFADRRLTRCTSAQRTRFQVDLTSRAAAARRTRVEANRSRPARRARQLMRPHYHRALTAFQTSEGPGPCVWRRLPGRSGQRGRKGTGRSVWDQRRSPGAAPCRAYMTRTRARKSGMSVEIARFAAGDKLTSFDPLRRSMAPSAMPTTIPISHAIAAWPPRRARAHVVS
jgi:Integrase core domain